MKKKKIILIAIAIIIILVVCIKLKSSKNVNSEIEEQTYAQNDEQIINESTQEGDDNKLPEETVENEEITEKVVEETKDVQVVETKKDDAKKSNLSNSKKADYFIKVNYQENVVTIYSKDENGEYTIPYKAMVCSTGSATPHSGTYTMPKGKNSRGLWGAMFGGVYAQYFVRIVGSILFHSVPYTEGWKDSAKGTLEYWEYDKLGTTASAGCVRLMCKDAKWIYDNCVAGTQVEFYADSNPGPLGKPTAPKISGDEEVRGWDPTDPSPKNPWKNYTSSNAKSADTNSTSTKDTNKKDTDDEKVPEDFDSEKGEYKDSID